MSVTHSGDELVSVPGKKYDMSVFYESIKEEHREPMKTKIKGEIPRWLEGSLYRNGAGLLEIGEDSYKHVFDGMALLHRYHIKDGQVTYQSQFLRSDNYKKNMKYNRIACSEFGTVVHWDPCLGLFGNIASYFLPPKAGDNCGVNFMYMGDELFAMTETNYMRRIDPKTLDTTDKDKIDITKYVAVNSASAHPHFLSDGTHYNMGSSFGKVCNYNIIKMELDEAGDQKWSILCSIPANGRDPSYYHSFGMTDDYIVYLEQPLKVNVFKVLTCKFRGLATTDCLDYHQNEKAYFHLVNRHTGERLPIKYSADAFFCFHHINAYQEDGHVVVDLCCYNNDEIIKRVYVDELKQTGLPPADEAQARRFVFPLKTDQLSKNENLVTLPNTTCTAKLADDGTVFCTSEVLIEQAFEAPRINYECNNGKPYQYIYGVLGNNQGMIKVDVKNKTYSVWEEEGYMPSEPVFVGAPSATSEDDGVVLSAVLNSDPDKPNFLVVLDGKSFKELGRAEFNVQLPYGIHGLFVPNI